MENLPRNTSEPLKREIKLPKMPVMLQPLNGKPYVQAEV